MLLKAKVAYLWRMYFASSWIDLDTRRIASREYGYGCEDCASLIARELVESEVWSLAVSGTQWLYVAIRRYL